MVKFAKLLGVLAVSSFLALLLMPLVAFIVVLLLLPVAAVSEDVAKAIFESQWSFTVPYLFVFLVLSKFMYKEFVVEANERKDND